MNKHILTVVSVATLILLGSFINISYFSSSSQVAAIAGAGSGLVGHWELESISNSSTADSVGNTTATLVGGPTAAASKVGDGAIRFDGVDDTMSFGDVSILDGSEAATVSVWAKFDQADADNTKFILGKYRGGGYSNVWYLLRNGDSQYSAVLYTTGGGASVLSSPYRDTQWHHLAIVYTGSTFSFYVDGERIGTEQPLTGTIIDSGHILCGWGESSETSCVPNAGDSGSLDDIRIYNKALSISDLQEIYAGGKDSATPEIVSVTPSVNPSGATIDVVFTETTTATLQYGPSTNYGQTLNSSSLSATHRFSVSGLNASTLYNYQITGIDAVNNTVISPNYTFTTGARDTTAPVISSVVVSTTHTGATITWSTNELTTSRVDYGLTTSYGAETSVNSPSSQHSVTLTGLTTGSQYNFKITSTDAAENVKVSGNATFTVRDNSAPIVTEISPAGKLSSATTQATLLVRTNENARCLYSRTAGSVFGEGDAVFSTTGGTTHSATVTGLSNGNSYQYFVRCTDDLGNVSKDHRTYFYVGAWVPPTGIPNPASELGYEIDRPTPTWPSQWTAPVTSAVANWYYIDNTAPNATNNNNPNGHPQRPRKELPGTDTGLLGNLPAGTVIYINGGTYSRANPGSNNIGFYYVGGRGTSANPIWIIGNPDNHPVFGRGVDIGYTQANHIIFDSIDMAPVVDGATTWTGSFEIRPKASNYSAENIIIRNGRMSSAKTWLDGNGIVIGGSATGVGSREYDVQNIVVYNMDISNYGDWLFPGEQDLAGVYKSERSNKVWVLDSRIYNMGGDSVAGSAHADAGDYKSERYYIGGNVLYQSGENAIDLKGVKHIIVSSNDISGPMGEQQGGGAIFHAGGPGILVQDVWLLFNRFHHLSSAAGLAGTPKGGTPFTSNIGFVGNVCYDVHGSYAEQAETNLGTCFASYSSIGPVYYVNNSMYDFENGIVQTGSANADWKAVIQGNIFSNKTAPTLGGSHYNKEWVVENYKDVVANNNYYAPSASFLYKGLNKNLSGLQSEGFETGSLSGNPLFINPTQGNLEIQSSSLAKDASREGATVPSVYDVFFNKYGLDIRKDIRGLSRPQGAAWDMGAYEYCTGANCTTPTIPTTKSLTVNRGGSGAGTINGNVLGIACSLASCSYSGVDGTSVTLTATPAQNSTFIGWSGGGCSGTGPCTFTLSANTTVTGTFNTSGVGEEDPPIISNINASSITSSGVLITWTTNSSSTSQVRFGTTATYGSFSALIATLLPNHQVSLIRLLPNTTYHYQVISRDAAGNTSTSTDRTFTTPLFNHGDRVTINIDVTKENGGVSTKVLPRGTQGEIVAGPSTVSGYKTWTVAFDTDLQDICPLEDTSCYGIEGWGTYSYDDRNGEAPKIKETFLTLKPGITPPVVVDAGGGTTVVTRGGGSTPQTPVAPAPAPAPEPLATEEDTTVDAPVSIMERITSPLMRIFSPKSATPEPTSTLEPTPEISTDSAVSETPSLPPAVLPRTPVRPSITRTLSLGLSDGEGRTFSFREFVQRIFGRFSRGE